MAQVVEVEVFPLVVEVDLPQVVGHLPESYYHITVHFAE
jgi:hypothetical protein